MINIKKIVLFSLLSLFVMSAYSQTVFRVTANTPEDLPATIYKEEIKTLHFTMVNLENKNLKKISLDTNFPTHPRGVSLASTSSDPNDCNTARGLPALGSCHLTLSLNANTAFPGFTNADFHICFLEGGAVCDLTDFHWNVKVIEPAPDNTEVLATPSVLNLTSSAPGGATEITNKTPSILAKSVLLHFNGLITSGQMTATVNGITVPGNADTAVCPDLGDNKCTVQVTANPTMSEKNQIQVTGANFDPVNIDMTYTLIPPQNTEVIASPAVLNLTSSAPGGATEITNKTPSILAKSILLHFNGLLTSGQMTATVNGVAVPGSTDTAVCPDLGDNKCTVQVTANPTMSEKNQIQVTGANFDPVNVDLTYTTSPPPPQISNLLAVGDLCYSASSIQDGSLTRNLPNICQNVRIRGVATDGVMFVAAGYTPNTVYTRLLTSQTWTPVSVASPPSLINATAVAYHGSAWVLAGNDANNTAVQIFTGKSQSDGTITWVNEPKSGIATYSDLNRIIWSDSLKTWFMVTAGNISANQGLIYSNSHSDGTGAWTAMNLIEQSDPVNGILLFDIACNPHVAKKSDEIICMAVGSYKNEGVVFKIRQGNRAWIRDSAFYASMPPLRSVAYNGTAWVVGGNGQTLYAYTASKGWQFFDFPDVPSNPKSFTALNWNGVRWFALGTGNLFYTSTDKTGATNWIAGTGVNNNWITQSITYPSQTLR